MPQTQDNGAITPVNSDAYNLAADLATMGKSLAVVTNVTSQAQRDGLAKFAGRTVRRLDLSGRLEWWNGLTWSTELRITIEGTTSSAPIMKTGTVTVASDGAGTAAIGFNEAFPNRCLGGVMTSVYTTSLGLVLFRFSEDLSNTGRLAFYCLDTSGNFLRNTSGIRLTFTAWGD
ncbi:MAG: hypothetical protein L0G87_01450 [Renibacterium salmoninarum]|nr:hypothetical protein [Renibacterium salmoninarum]